MKPHWDHAFASGSACKEPRARGLFLVDWFFHCAERLYGNSCIRRLWASWKKACVYGKDVRLGGNARIINKNRRESVRIGDSVVCKGIIRVESSGHLNIAELVYIGDSSIISVAESVTIGKGTLIAHGVQIFDNVSHPIEWQERQNHFKKLLGYPVTQAIIIPSAPVVIGENCWLGMGCMVLKGVTIGDRSIIGAGCVITKDVPPDTLVVGGGAKFISKSAGAV